VKSAEQIRIDDYLTSGWVGGSSDADSAAMRELRDMVGEDQMLRDIISHGY